MRKGYFVALGTRTPHCRTFGTIQHPELKGGTVCDKTGVSSESIYLTDYLTFGNSTYGRIARHLRKGESVHCEQQNGSTETCGGHSSLATCVSPTDNYYVKTLFH